MKKSNRIFLPLPIVKAVIFLLVFTLGFITISFAQVQTQTPVTTFVSTGRINGYLESLPVTYNSEPTKKFPLIIFIHGKGEMGDGSTAALDKVTANGIPKLIKQGKFPSSFTVNGEKFSFIVISPQISANNYSQAPIFIGDLLEYCKKKYRIDEQRIYITGLSMGGGITWSTLVVHAASFAAAVPVCGSYSLVSAGAKLMADTNLPVWCTHNDGDPTVSVEVTKKWYNALVSYNANPAPKMTIFASASHDAWSKTYDPAYKEDAKNIYEWMLSYKRGGAVVTPLPPVANAGADQTITLPVNSVTIDATKSSTASGTITAYAWSKVSGPTQGSITNSTSGSTTVTGLIEGVYTFQVKITDSNGGTATDNLIVTVKAAPLPPVANAGSAQSITLPINSVTLDGSKSSAPSGSLKSYQWTKISGPLGGTITSADAVSTTVTSLVEGVYTFELKVTDTNNASATATVTVTVYAAPVPPVAVSGGDQEIELPQNQITLDGSKSSASSGSITTYEWTKLSGPAEGTISAPNQAQTTVTGMVEGVYEFQLKVTDSKGNSAIAKMSVLVNPAKVPPTADAGVDQSITLPGNEVELTGAASQAAPGRTLAKFEWVKIAGPAEGAISTPSAQLTKVNSLIEGVYSFELTVTDDLGQSSTASVTVTVKAAPLPPVANAGSNQTITLPVNTVVLDGGKSVAVSSAIKSYQWSKVSGPVDALITSASSIKTDVSGLVEGTYVWELKVTDENGLTAIATVSTIVKPAAAPPVASAGEDQVIILPNNTTELNGTGSSANAGTIKSFAWTQQSGPSGAVIQSGTSAIAQVSGLEAGTYEFLLKVVGDNGLSSTDIVTVNVVDAPTAYAGEDIQIMLPVNSTTLEGMASVIPAGSIATYRWSKISGPGSGTIVDPNAVNTVVSGLVEGIYEFELEIKDQYESFSKDKVIVTVLRQPKAPTANAGADMEITLPQHTVTLDGSLSSGEIEIVGYDWKKVSGPAAGNIKDAAASITAVENLQEGIYEFELTIRDKNGLTATASVSITVHAEPLPPVADAGSDQTISLPVNTINLTGIGTGNNIVAYSWRLTSGANDMVIEDINAASTSVSNLKEGVYVFELEVTDENGLTAKDVTTITVNAAPEPPVADAGLPQIITLPLSEATLDGSLSSAPAGTIDKYEWIKISGPTQGNIMAADAAITLVNNLVEGVYKYQLKVTDNNGATSTSTVSVTVMAAPQPPVANAGNAQTITLPMNSVVLDGSKSIAPDGSIISYEWSKLSGPAGEQMIESDQAKATANELIEGVYQFELKITDNNGAVSTATVTVTVKAAPLPPVANAGTAQTITLPVNVVELNGSASIAPAGNIEKYEWMKISGPDAGEISEPYAVNTSITNLKEGIYTFQLKITDNNGASATASVTITVKAALLAPEANAGPDVVIVLPANSVDLNGGKSKALSGSITVFRWRQVSGTGVAVLSGADNVNMTVSSLVEGIYEFELEVVDDNEGKDLDTVRVTVLPAPLPPTANAGKDTSIRLPVNSISLNGTLSSATSTTIESFSWNQISGPSTAQLSDNIQSIAVADQLMEGIYKFELTVTDKNGMVSKDSVAVTVLPALVAPLANAGSDQQITLPLNSVTLNASASSDADGSIVSYKWVKISGPSAGSLLNSNSVSTTAVNLVQGKYVYEVTVKDNDGLIAKARVIITVNPAPALPVANAGSSIDITLPVNQVTLDGSKSSAPGGAIDKYSWTMLSGPGTAAITNPANATTQVQSLIVGTYVFELEITDSNGATAKASVSVTVNAAPLPPLANAGSNQTITLPVNTVTLNGSKSSASGAIERYEWLKLSGPSSGTIVKPLEAVTTVSGLKEGIYQFQLKITDNNGLSATSQVTITVKAAPLPPVANAGAAQELTLPETKSTLDGSQSFGVSANIVKYEWTVNSGPSGAVLSSPATAVTDVTSLKEGRYEFILEVTDELNNTATATVVVEVKSAPANPPVAIAGKSFTVQLPAQNIKLDGSQSYASDNASIMEYVWTKVSGPNPVTLINASTATPTVVASEPGNYLFRLTVTDNRGLSSYDDLLIIVLPKIEEQPLPVASAGETVVLTLPDNVAQLNGWASYSQYGEIISYSWKLLTGPSQPNVDNPAADMINVSNLMEGEYEFELTVVDNNGKSASDTVKVIVTNAGGKQDFSAAVKVYPNPLQTTGIVEIRSNAKGRTIIDVYDMNAKRMLRKEFVKDGFGVTHPIDLSALPKGVYMVQVIVDYQYRTVVKVIKN